MAEGESDVIDPLAGRILGAGSNDLQRSIDANSRVVQSLASVLRKDVSSTPSSAAWYTRADGRQVLNNPKPNTPAPLGRTTSVLPLIPAQPTYTSRQQTTSVGGGVSLDKTGSGLLTAGAVVPLTPTSGYSSRGRTTTVGFAQQVPQPQVQALAGANGGAGGGVNLGKVASPPSGGNGGGIRGNYLIPPGGVGGDGGGGGGFNWRNAAWNARKISNQVGAWGAGLVKTGSVMDTYSQWAGIANAAPYSADGTNGGSVNAIRKFVFGSQGENLTGWAQNVRDAQAAAFTVSRNSGFSELTPGTQQTINPQFASYLGNVKDLSILNPTLNASQTASMVGTLTSTRGLYAAQMYGYRPLLSQGGRVDRNALGGFADSVLQRTFQGQASVRPEELKAALGQNGSLHGNISAYVRSAGGDDTMVQALEDYVTGRNTAQQRGLSGSDFDSLLADYQRGGDAGKRAEKRLQKFGVSNTILQSQKDLSGAKTGNVSDLMDTLGPAVKRANEALEKFYNWLDDIVNLPGVKQTVGTIAGWGSVFGPAVGSAFGAMAGMRLGGGVLGTAGSLMGLRGVGGAGALTGAAGGGGALLRGGAYGAGAVGIHVAGNSLADNIDDPGLKAVAKYLTTVGTWGAAGAAVGSVVPVVGTGLGAAIGAGVGAVKGLWDGFHDDSSTGNDGIGGGASGNKGSKGATATSGEAISGKSAAGAINAALAEVGKPYEWGGVGPDAFDCSGLMRWAYRKVGVELPRVSQDQMRVGKPVEMEDARPGDLLFPYPGHVAMYLGNGKLVEAPRPGKNIRVAPVSEYGKYAAIRRIVGSVGSYSGAEDQDANTQQKQSGNLGGDSGSQVMGGDYGSTEEVDAVTSALAGAKHTLLNTPMNNSSSSSESDGSSSPDLSGVDTSGPWKKDAASIKKAQALGKSLAASKYNWTGSEWDSLYKLWTGESNWRWWAENSSSGAYGIVQSLPGNKMASEGKDWKTNPATQIKWGLKYIKERYGDPNKAYSTWKSRSPHWYDTGAWDIPEDQHAVVHKGEMIIEKPKADTIRQALMRDVVNMKDASSVGKSTGGSGGGGGITLNFQNGSVVFSISGGATEAGARNAANTFATALAENDRLKALAEGL